MDTSPSPSSPVVGSPVPNPPAPVAPPGTYPGDKPQPAPKPGEPGYIPRQPGDPLLPGDAGYADIKPPTASAKRDAPNATLDYSPILGPNYTAPTEGQPGYAKAQVREGEFLVEDAPGNLMGALPPGSVIGKTVDNQYIAYIPYRGSVSRILGDTNADVEQLVVKARNFFQSQYHIGVPI